MFGEGAIVFFVDVGCIDVDSIVFLRRVFDEWESVFDEKSNSWIIECPGVELREVLFAGFNYEIINFDHMDGG